MRQAWLLALGLVVACGKSGGARCQRFVDDAEKDCIRSLTQSIYIGGKNMGQLQDDATARARCKKSRAKDLAWCKKAPDDVLACATKPPDDPERKGARCQVLLTDYWNATHPDEQHDVESAPAPARPPDERQATAAPDDLTVDLATRVQRLVANHDYDGAIAALERGIPDLEARLGSDHPTVADALGTLGGLYRLDGKPAEAVAPLERALASYMKLLGPEHMTTGSTEFALAQALWDADQDRKRARGLAEGARAVAAAASAHDAVTQVDAWLAAHP